jgi:hypothetical protein
LSFGGRHNRRCRKGEPGQRRVGAVRALSRVGRQYFAVVGRGLPGIAGKHDLAAARRWRLDRAQRIGQRQRKGAR